MKKIIITTAVILFSISISYAQENQPWDSGRDYIDCSRMKVYKVTVHQVNRVENSTKSGDLGLYISESTTYNASAIYLVDANGNPETLIRVVSPHAGWYKYGGMGYSSTTTYYSCDFTVFPGTKRIASGAFTNTSDIISVHIPTSVKYMPPGIVSKDFIDFYSGSSPSAINAEEIVPESSNEIARYNIQGMKVKENDKGVQIIQYDNGTAKKIIVN